MENRRSIVAINLTFRPKSKVLKNFFLYKSLQIYNNIPKEIKILKQEKFKIQIKNYIRNNNISDSMD